MESLSLNGLESENQALVVEFEVDCDRSNSEDHQSVGGIEFDSAACEICAPSFIAEPSNPEPEEEMQEFPETDRRRRSSRARKSVSISEEVSMPVQRQKSRTARSVRGSSRGRGSSRSRSGSRATSQSKRSSSRKPANRSRSKSNARKPSVSHRGRRT